MKMVNISSTRYINISVFGNLLIVMTYDNNSILQLIKRLLKISQKIKIIDIFKNFFLLSQQIRQPADTV